MNWPKNLLFIVLFIAFSVASVKSQGITAEDMALRIQEHSLKYPQTKLFLHTDKPYYALGEDLWFAIYSVDASDMSRASVSDVIYVDLLDSEKNIVISKSYRLQDRFAHGDIEIERDWEQGEYILRAYTSYMRNFDEGYLFEKTLSFWERGKEEVISKENELKKEAVRFFPEGGELVEGIECKVAFELADPSIESIELVDENNETITRGRVGVNGIGSFTFTPEKEKSYTAKVDEKTHVLPKVRKSGFGISVNNLSEDVLFVNLKSSEGKTLEGCYLIAHLRGQPFLVREDLSGSETTLKIDKSVLPDGVSQVTLFENSGYPVLERTIFVRRPSNEVNVQVNTPYEYYNQRQRAILNFDLANASGLPLDGVMSVSVVDGARVFGMEKVENIESYFLMGSEFLENIENSNIYFKDYSKKTAFLTDQLMMVRGWTRIKWVDMALQNEPEIQFTPESGFTIRGTVYRKGFPTRANIEFSVLGEGFTGGVVTTEADGSFSITGIELKEGEQIFLKASQPSADPQRPSTSNGLRLVLDYVGKPSSANLNFDYDGPNKGQLEDYIDMSFRSYTVDSMYASMFVELEAVEIEATDLSLNQKIRRDFEIAYTHYDRRLFLDSLGQLSPYRTIFDIVADEVPGVQVVGVRGSDQRFRIRGGSNSLIGNTDAKIMLDGAIVSYEFLNTINPQRIAFIDVLRGLSSTAIYNAPNGLIAIYLRRDTDYGVKSYIQPDYVAKIQDTGFSVTREFYSPNYERTFAGSEKPDLRSTLYWAPKVVCTAGNATLEFFTADQSTQYVVEVQGITVDGRPFVHYGSFEVR